jgi:hypothetical protein
MARIAPAPGRRSPAAPGAALDVPAARLTAQQLTAPRLGTPAALVGWFGALQAQDPAAARWAVGLRLRVAAGQLSHLLVIAELEEVAVSGVPLDGQATWSAFDERVPQRRGRFDREATLAALALRYVRSRGPATAADLAWFAGATLAEARAALTASRGPLVEVRAEGRTLWQAADATAAPPEEAGVHLLPAFDEYLVGYRRRDDVLDPRHFRAINAGGGLLDPVVVAGGRVVGTWRRALGRREVTIEVELFGPVRPLRQGVEAAAARYGEFLGLEPCVAFRRFDRE